MFQQFLLCARADGEHGDNCADAEHDAEDAEQRAEFVKQHALHGDAQHGDEKGNARRRWMLRGVRLALGRTRRKPCQGFEPWQGCPGRFDAFDCAVFQMENALGKRGNARLMRDDDQRMPLLMQCREQRHDLVAGAAVKVAGRLIGQNHARLQD